MLGIDGIHFPICNPTSNQLKVCLKLRKEVILKIEFQMSGPANHFIGEYLGTIRADLGYLQLPADIVLQHGGRRITSLLHQRHLLDPEVKDMLQDVLVKAFLGGKIVEHVLLREAGPFRNSFQSRSIEAMFGKNDLCSIKNLLLQGLTIQ